MEATDPRREVDALMFQVDKSMRYHQRFRGFYDTFHRAFMFVIIAAGGGAALKFSATPPEYVGVGVALVAALNLVWAPSHRARDHHLLHGRFAALLIQIRSGEWTEENRVRWDAERHKIEKDEPPIFYALEADCDNQVRRAWGRTKSMVEIGWWSRRTMYFLRHAPRQFDERPA